MNPSSRQKGTSPGPPPQAKPQRPSGRDELSERGILYYSTPREESFTILLRERNPLLLCVYTHIIPLIAAGAGSLSRLTDREGGGGAGEREKKRIIIIIMIIMIIRIIMVITISITIILIIMIITIMRITIMIIITVIMIIMIIMIIR